MKVMDTEFEIRRTALDAALDLSRRSDCFDVDELVASAKVIEDYLNGKDPAFEPAFEVEPAQEAAA